MQLSEEFASPAREYDEPFGFRMRYMLEGLPRQAVFLGLVQETLFPIIKTSALQGQARASLSPALGCEAN